MLKFSSRTDLETYFSDLAGSECPPNDSPEFEEAVDNLLSHAYSVCEDEWHAYGSDWTQVFDDLNDDTFWALFPAPKTYKVSQAGLLQIAHHLITQVPLWAQDYVHFVGLKPPMTTEELFEPIHKNLAEATCLYASEIEKEAAEEPQNIDYAESPAISFDTGDRSILQFNGSPVEFEEISLEVEQ